MPGWVVERYDYAELRVHVSTAVCARQPHDHAVYNQAANETNAGYNMSYQGCDAMLRCLL